MVNFGYNAEIKDIMVREAFVSFCNFKILLIPNEDSISSKKLSLDDVFELAQDSLNSFIAVLPRVVDISLKRLGLEILDTFSEALSQPFIEVVDFETFLPAVRNLIKRHKRFATLFTVQHANPDKTQRRVMPSKFYIKDVTGRRVTALGMSILAKPFRSSSRYTEIQLPEHRCGTQGVGILNKVLSNFSCLRILNLSSNGLEGGVLKHLAMLVRRNILAELILDDNSLPGIALEYLAKGLILTKSLKKLSLKGNTLKKSGKLPSNFGGSLSVNTSLKSLNLSNCHLDPEMINLICLSLVNNCCLRTLDLSDNVFPDHGTVSVMSPLLCNKGLKNLSLADCYPEETTIRCVSELLRRSKQLRYLNLRALKIGPSAMASMGEALKLSPSIRYVSFDGMNLLEENSSTLLTTAITLSGSLCYLDIRNQRLPAERMTCVVSTLGDSQHLEGVAFSNIDFRVDMWNLFSRFDGQSGNLEQWNLENQIISMIRENQNLAWLSFFSSFPSNISYHNICETIVDNSCMETLDLSGCSIDADCALLIAQTLKRSKTIRSLILQKVYLNSDGLVCLVDLFLASLSLKHVDLRGNELGDIAKAQAQNVCEQKGIQLLTEGRITFNQDVVYFNYKLEED